MNEKPKKKKIVNEKAIVSSFRDIQNLTYIQSDLDYFNEFIANVIDGNKEVVLSFETAGGGEPEAMKDIPVIIPMVIGGSPVNYSPSDTVRDLLFNSPEEGEEGAHGSIYIPISHATFMRIADIVNSSYNRNKDEILDRIKNKLTV